MRNAPFSTWSMKRKLLIMENEKHTLEDMEYGEKHGKTGKIRNAQGRTWSMARKIKKCGK